MPFRGPRHTPLTSLRSFAPLSQGERGGGNEAKECIIITFNRNFELTQAANGASHYVTPLKWSRGGCAV